MMEKAIASALQELEWLEPRASAIQAFHARHKLLLLACLPTHYSELGRIAARAGGSGDGESLAAYRHLFREALASPPTQGRLVNALDHAAGYFRDERFAEERARVASAVDDFRLGRVPFTETAAVLRGAAERAGIDYLVAQSLFT